MKLLFTMIFVTSLECTALAWHGRHRHIRLRSCPLGSPCECQWDPVNIWPNQRDSIDCRGNEIITSELPRRRATLRRNRSFKEIDFSHNKLEDVPSGYLNHMIKLKVLDFSYNSMQVVPAVIASRRFRCKHSLKELYLDSNGIDLEGNSRFVHLDHLNILSMKNNVVRRIQLTTFRGLCRLIRLDLSYNRIEYVQVSAFQQMAFLKELDMSDNKLSNLGSQVFPRLRQLAVLNLSSNQLRRFPRRFFSRLPLLESLDVSRNTFEDLSFAHFNGISDHLQYFNVSYNQINSFESNVFDILLSLHKLDISGNPITCLPILSSLKDLEELYIIKTNVSHIYPCQLEGLDKLDTLFWSLSPIGCDCQNNWIRDWYSIQMSTIAKEKTEAELPWNCHSPPNTLGLRLYNINISETDCHQKRKYCFSGNNCYIRNEGGSNHFPGEDSDNETDGSRIMSGTETSPTTIENSTTETTNSDLSTAITNSTSTQDILSITEYEWSNITTGDKSLEIDETTIYVDDTQTKWMVMLAQNDKETQNEKHDEHDNISLVYGYRLLFVVICTVAILVIIMCICCTVLHVMKKKKWLQDKDNKVHAMTSPKDKVTIFYAAKDDTTPPLCEINTKDNMYNFGNVDHTLEGMFQQNLWDNINSNSKR